MMDGWVDGRTEKERKKGRSALTGIGEGCDHRRGEFAFDPRDARDPDAPSSNDVFQSPVDDL